MNAAKTKQNKTDLQLALKSMKKIFISLGIYSFFLNILMLAAPFYMLVVYDIVMPSKNMNTLLLVTLITLVFFIGMWILDHVRSKLMIYASNRLDTIMSNRLFDATFDLAAKYPNNGNIQPMKDFNTIKSFLGGSAVFAFFDFPWFPIYIAIMFLFSPIFGLYGLIATAVIILLTWLNEKTTKEGLETSDTEHRQSMNFLDNISADTITLENSRSDFYIVLIEIIPKGFNAISENNFKIIPGMPSATFIHTGKKTLLEYLTQPIIQMYKGIFHAN
jgi:ATP-binding cassette subfamily C protein EexD